MVTGHCAQVCTQLRSCRRINLGVFQNLTIQALSISYCLSNTGVPKIRFVMEGAKFKQGTLFFKKAYNFLINSWF